MPLPVEDWIFQAQIPSGIQAIPLSCEIALASATLPMHHKDLADRIIIATAIKHNARLVSLDSIFPAYQELGNLLVAG